MTDGRQAYFLFLDEGEDPDSVVRARCRSAGCRVGGRTTP